MTTLEKAQHFIRTNGIWDVSYADGTHLSDRLARFIDEERDAGLVDPQPFLKWASQVQERLMSADAPCPRRKTTMWPPEMGIR